MSADATLSDYLAAFRRHWRLSAAIALAVLAVIVPIAVGLPSLYRGTASLVVDQLPDTINGSDQVGLMDGRLQAIKQEALSRQRLTELVEQFNLYPELRARGQLDDVIERVQKDVKVEITSTNTASGNPTTVAFTASYVATSPDVAARVANQLASFYVQQSDAMRTKQASRTADLIKSELDKTRAELDEEEGRIVSFAGSNAGGLPQQITSTMAKYTQLAQQVQSNRNEEATLRARRDDLQARIADLMTPRANADVADPRLKLAQAEHELEAMKLVMQPTYPDYRAKEREIAQLKVEINQTDPSGTSASTAPLATYQNQLADLDKRLKDLDTSGKQLSAQLSQFDGVLAQAPVRDAQFDKISNDVRALRDTYDELNKRYQDAVLNERAQQGASGEEFHIVDPATPLKSPAGPNRMMLIGAAFGLALVLAVCVPIVMEQFDGSFRSLDELRAFTSVPVLATIPRIATRGERTRRVASRTVLTAMAGAVLLAIGLQVFYLAQRSEAVARMLVR